MNIHTCALFDLDGVIVDTAKYHFLAWKNVALNLGYELSKENNEKLKGVSRADCLNIILKLAKLNLNKNSFNYYLKKKNDIYLDYVKSSYASEARTVMSNINNASKMYYQTRGEWPPEIDELERAGHLDVSRSTKLKWSFDLQLSDQGGRITATSTEEMSGGAGHQVVYDADLGKFTGYGSE